MNWIEYMEMNAKMDDVHVGSIEGNPVEVESLDIVNGMLQEGVTGGSSHERVVNADREPGRGDPVDGKEEVHWLEAFDVEVNVYAAKFVENKVSDYVRALNFCCGARWSTIRVGMGMAGVLRTHPVRNRGRSRGGLGSSLRQKRLLALYPKARTATGDRGGVLHNLHWLQSISPSSPRHRGGLGG